MFKYHYDLQGSSNVVRSFPVYGAGSAINIGSVVVRGATTGTDLGFMILSTAVTTDVVGITEEAHAAVAAGLDSKQDGTAIQFRRVSINPLGVYIGQYDTTDTMAVASTSGTTVTITSLESNLDGGWLYAVAGTGKGSLYYITTSTSGSCTTMTATGWDSTTTVIKLVPRFHPLLKLTTTMDNIGTDAGAGSGVVTTLDSYFEADGYPFQRLDATKHNGLTSLDTRSTPRFYTDVIFRNHALNSID